MNGSEKTSQFCPQLLLDEPVIHEQDPLYHASLAWERPVET